MRFPITENGSVNVSLKRHNSKSIIYTGDLSGATLTLTCHGVPLTDGVLTPNAQVIVEHGHGAPIKVEATSVTTSVHIYVYAAE